MVEAQGKVMVVVDVPVESAKELEIVLVGTPVGVGTRVVTVFFLEKFAYSVKVVLGGS